MANKAALRRFFEKDASTCDAFIPPDQWEAVVASKNKLGGKPAPNVVLIDGPVTLRSITETHQTSGLSAYMVVRNQLKRYLEQRSTRVVAFVVDKATVAEEKGVIQKHRKDSSNANSHAFREALFEIDIAESIAAVTLASAREVAFEIGLEDFRKPTGAEAFFDCNVDVSEKLKRITHHDEISRQKLEGAKMTQTTYTLLDTSKVCDALNEMVPDMASLLAASGSWPLPLPWSDVCGKERVTIMQWITRMLLYSEKDHMTVPMGKTLILDGHYMDSTHEVNDDGTYNKKPKRCKDDQYIPFVVTNSHTDGFAGLYMTNDTLESIQLEAFDDEEIECDTVYGRYPDFRNKIGEAEMAFFFYIVELAKKSPSAHLCVELVSVDTDVLVYSLMFLAMCKDGLYGDALKNSPPHIYHNYGRGVTSKEVCDVTLLYNLIVARWFRGNHSLIYSLVGASVASGSDYVLSYYFITCERFLEVCKSQYFDFVNMRDPITGELREPLCRILPNGKIQFSGKAYRRLVAAVYSQKHRPVFAKITTLLPVETVRTLLRNHVMKKDLIHDNFDALVEAGAISKDKVELYIKKYMKLLPPDEQIKHRGMQTFRMMKILRQLGVSEIKNPGEKDPTKYGFRLKDESLPPSRTNLRFAAKHDHLYFRKRWREAIERRAKKVTGARAPAHGQ